MSFRRLGRGAFRLTQQLIFRIRGINAAQKLASRIFRVAPQATQLARAAAVAPRSSNAFFRGIQTVFRSIGARAFIRPFAVFDHNRLRYDSNRISKRFKAFPWRFYSRDTSELIRNVFVANLRYNPYMASPELPNRIDDYEIGSNIACGCNAAVYELRVNDAKKPQSSDSCSQVASTSSASTVDGSEKNVQERLSAYPLALKIMFNYQFNAPERLLWSEMGAELVPLTSGKHLLSGRMKSLKILPHPHPNVVKMYTAFTDRMPILPDASSLYPDALPTADFYELILHEPKTLLIVMKRYRMNLHEYALTVKRNYWTARVMYAQLLEAITYLYDHTICHRDMKSDNILLDFDSETDIPHLVLGDFGCALSTGSWTVEYFDDSVDLGGNLALRAPEVRCARPGPNQVVDFRMADLWAAATLGYEMFTRCNPFYSRMKSNDYAECELPELPKRVHYAVKGVTKDMLRRNPSKRPNPHVAANVVSISLFRFGEDVRKFLNECGIEDVIIGSKIADLGNAISGAINRLGKKAQRTLNDVAMLYATETIMARRLCPEVISKAELQLRATFLSRLDREMVWSALGYFYAFDEDLTSSISSWPTAETEMRPFQKIDVRG